MKFSNRLVVVVALLAVVMVSMVSFVSAGDPCAPTSSPITAQVSCSTPTPDPCAPDRFGVVPQVSCSTPPPAPTVEPTTEVKPVNMDTVVSFNDTDLGVILYKSQDEAGNLQMDVYSLTTGGIQSSYLFTITQSDLAPFANQKPAANTLLASAGGVSVYVLTTGEIQVSAGPDAEGKYHVKVLNGIPWTAVYGFTIDPQ